MDAWRRLRGAATKHTSLDGTVGAIKQLEREQAPIPPWLLDVRELLRGSKSVRLGGEARHRKHVGQRQAQQAIDQALHPRVVAAAAVVIVALAVSSLAPSPHGRSLAPPTTLGPSGSRAAC